MSEVTVLPTKPQPLPKSVAGFNKKELVQKIRATYGCFGMSMGEKNVDKIL